MLAETKPQLSDFLKQQGLKWTPERERVLQDALATAGHFEAEELAYRVGVKKRRVSKATVYRTLPILVRAGFLNEVIHGEKHLHYEHARKEQRHDHLICMKCGKIVEFKEESLREIEEKVCEKNQFQPQKILIEIFGCCRKCQ